MSLGGGGYRAAAFSLGVMLYLADAKLLDCVRAVASVSGGSITNAFSAWMIFARRKDGTAVDYWNEAAPLLRILSNDDLLHWRGGALKRVSPPSLLALFFATRASAPLRKAYLAATTAFVVPLFVHREYMRINENAGRRLQNQLTRFGPTSPRRFAPITVFGRALYLLVFRGAGHAKAALAEGGSKRDRDDRPLLENINCAFRPIFCCTDVASGKPFYMSNRFISVPIYDASKVDFVARGGKPKRMPISRAVIASAGFPGGFQPTVVHSSKVGVGAGAPSEYRLLDGGLYDNLGFTFFKHWRGERGEKLDEAVTSELGQLPEYYVFVNSSVPIFQSHTPTGPLRAFRRGLTVLHYANSQSRHEQAAAFLASDSVKGTVIDIGDDPYKIPDEESDWSAEAREGMDRLSERVKYKQLDWQVAHQELSQGVPTGLTGLGSEMTARLVFQGYAVALARMTTAFGFPVPDDLPTIAGIQMRCSAPRTSVADRARAIRDRFRQHDKGRISARIASQAEETRVGVKPVPRVRARSLLGAQPSGKHGQPHAKRLL